MESITKRFQTTKIYKFDYLFYFFLIIAILSIFFNVLNYFNLKESIQDFDKFDSGFCEYFIITPSLQSQIENKSIEFSKKEIYVFPELENLKCIGRVGEFYIENNQIKGYVYTNTKLVNYIILIFNFSQIIFHYFFNFYTKKNFYSLLCFVNLILFFNFYNSINLVSYNFLFTSFLIIYFFENEA